MGALRKGLSLLMRRLSPRRSSKLVEEDVKMEKSLGVKDKQCRDRDGKWRK